MALIDIRNISKIYKMGDNEVHALRDVSLSIEAGDFIAIMGPSGSGKSTLSNILGLLDIPTRGQYFLNQQEISNLNEDEQAAVRSNEIGFIFQQFNLLPRLSAEENVELPLLYSKNLVEEKRGYSLLGVVDLQSRHSHRPNELSGGQQQRVAIARSLINNPRIILADEPTGNLDSKSEKEIMSVLHQLNTKGITVIMVTHEDEIGLQAKRLIRMRDGQIVSDERLAPIPAQQENYTPYQKAKSSPLNDFWRYFEQGYKTLMANKIRSALSMLGILIGVAAVVAILALGKGANQAVEEQLSTLGSNLINVRPGNRRTGGVAYQGGALKLLTTDAAFLKQAIPSIKDTNANVDSRAQVAYLNKNWNSMISGVQENYPKIKNWDVTLGRFFTQAEDQSRARVCLIGTTLQKELFGSANPIGATIKINRVNYQVIGVMAEKSAGGWRDQNDIVIVPLQTAMKRILGKDSVDSIDIVVTEPSLIAQTEKDVLELLTTRKRVPMSQKENAFQIMNMNDIQDMISQSNKTISTLLTAVAAISLLVGGIGIMNIMLVSVTERTKEIGLRKAIGAKKRDILIQFLSEAVVLSASGGVIGVLLAWLITFSLSALAGWNTSISLTSVCLSVLFSSFIGILFGLYPAKRASELTPIDALRYE